MEHYLYLTLDLGSILVPILFSFQPWAPIARRLNSVVPAIIIPATVFLIWDIWFTGMGVWGFSPRYLTGIYFFNLPIEEVLFFICIPYACLFSYEAINHLRKEEPLPNYGLRITVVLIIGLTITGIRYIDRWYTSVTFISLAAFLLILQLTLRPRFLGRFYFAYLFILIPFFIVNGVLTGTGLPQPVVWYDNTENLGIRMLTIPFEDTFYGMLLLMMNVTIYEYLERRKGRGHNAAPSSSSYSSTPGSA